MKIKYEDCSHMQDITLDDLIFDDEDEEIFVNYLAAELSKSQNNKDEKNKKINLNEKALIGRYDGWFRSQ